MDNYAQFKRQSSKLKLKGLRLRAEGGMECEFEAAVALHAAARLERAAQACLPVNFRDARLASAIEECGCYIDALAPRWAARAWVGIDRILLGESTSQGAEAHDDLAQELTMQRDSSIGLPGLIVYASSDVTLKIRVDDPSLNRIREAFISQQRAFRRALLECPVFVGRMSHGTLVPDSPRERVRLEKELDSLAIKFPGDAHLWFSIYRIKESIGKTVPGISALRRAVQLEPSDDRFKVMLMYGMSSVPEFRGEYENLIDEIFERREQESHEALIFHAFAMMRIANVSPEQAENALRMAQEDLRMAAEKPPLLSGRTDLQTAQSLLDVQLAGRRPSDTELIEFGVLDRASTRPEEVDWTFLMQQRLAHGLGRGVGM